MTALSVKDFTSFFSRFPVTSFSILMLVWIDLVSLVFYEDIPDYLFLTAHGLTVFMFSSIAISLAARWHGWRLRTEIISYIALALLLTIFTLLSANTTEDLNRLWLLGALSIIMIFLAPASPGNYESTIKIQSYLAFKLTVSVLIAIIGLTAGILIISVINSFDWFSTGFFSRLFSSSRLLYYMLLSVGVMFLFRLPAGPEELPEDYTEFLKAYVPLVILPLAILTVLIAIFHVVAYLNGGEIMDLLFSSVIFYFLVIVAIYYIVKPLLDYSGPARLFNRVFPLLLSGLSVILLKNAYGHNQSSEAGPFYSFICFALALIAVAARFIFSRKPSPLLLPAMLAISIAIIFGLTFV